MTGIAWMDGPGWALALLLAFAWLAVRQARRERATRSNRPLPDVAEPFLRPVEPPIRKISLRAPAAQGWPSHDDEPAVPAPPLREHVVAAVAEATPAELGAGFARRGRW